MLNSLILLGFSIDVAVPFLYILLFLLIELMEKLNLNNNQIIYIILMHKRTFPFIWNTYSDKTKLAMSIKLKIKML